jgi:hypothetical protein
MLFIGLNFIQIAGAGRLEKIIIEGFPAKVNIF